MIRLSENWHIGHPAKQAGLVLVFAWFLLGGIAHFLFTDVFVHAMPSYVPYARDVVLLTGVCEIAGALGLLTQRFRVAAGWALMAFVFCVTPVHIEMLQHAEHYRCIGEPLLWARLFFQPIFAWIIWKVSVQPSHESRTARHN